jgi:DNA-binding HxlR family transcriptional regulator
MMAVLMPEHDAERCRVIRDAFARIGDKWSLLVIVTLSHGPLRFTALKVGLEGISQRMLTLTLRKLEVDGLVRRTVYAEVPPRVEYELTDAGRSLIPPVTALADWAVAHHAALEGVH